MFGFTSRRTNRYAEYLASPRWHQLRSEALERDGYRCRGCDTDEGLQVHHRWYPDVIGTETVDDLTTLCASCHDAIHRAIGRKAKPRFSFFRRRRGYPFRLFRPSPWRILG